MLKINRPITEAELLKASETPLSALFEAYENNDAERIRFYALNGLGVQASLYRASKKIAQMAKDPKFKGLDLERLSVALEASSRAVLIEILIIQETERKIASEMALGVNSKLLADLEQNNLIN